MSPSRMPATPSSVAKNQLSLFESALGWFGLVGTKNGVTALSFGHHTPGEVHERLLGEGQIARLTSPIDWYPDLRKRLQEFAQGNHDDFADVTVDANRSTPFQNRVVLALRTVGCGCTLSYAELAALAGAPGTARAVGRVMATNPVPIIVPCHRVVGSGGHLGGYSAPGGLNMKRRLLELEASAVICPTAT